MSLAERFATILKVVSPSHFIIREVEYENSASSHLERDLQYLFTKYDIQTEFPELPAKGEIVAVKLERQKLWCRARVEAIIETSKGATVSAYLVDYGKIATVRKEWVRKLKEELRNIPFQALEFLLLGLQPLTLKVEDDFSSARLSITDRWDTSTLEFVNVILPVDTKVKILVETMDVQGNQYGELFVFDGNDVISLNKLLINNDHAVYSEEAVKNILTIPGWMQQEVCDGAISRPSSSRALSEKNPNQLTQQQTSKYNSETDSGVTIEQCVLMKHKKTKEAISELQESRRRIMPVEKTPIVLPECVIAKSKMPLGRGCAPVAPSCYVESATSHSIECNAVLNRETKFTLEQTSLDPPEMPNVTSQEKFMDSVPECRSTPNTYPLEFKENVQLKPLTKLPLPPRDILRMLSLKNVSSKNVTGETLSSDTRAKIVSRSDVSSKIHPINVMCETASSDASEETVSRKDVSSVISPKNGSSPKNVIVETVSSDTYEKARSLRDVSRMISPIIVSPSKNVMGEPVISDATENTVSREDVSRMIIPAIVSPPKNVNNETVSSNTNEKVRCRREALRMISLKNVFSPKNLMKETVDSEASEKAASINGALGGHVSCKKLLPRPIDLMLRRSASKSPSVPQKKLGESNLKSPDKTVDLASESSDSQPAKVFYRRMNLKEQKVTLRPSGSPASSTSSESIRISTIREVKRRATAFSSSASIRSAVKEAKTLGERSCTSSSNSKNVSDTDSSLYSMKEERVIQKQLLPQKHLQTPSQMIGKAMPISLMGKDENIVMSDSRIPSKTQLLRSQEVCATSCNSKSENQPATSFNTEPQNQPSTLFISQPENQPSTSSSQPKGFRLAMALTAAGRSKPGAGTEDNVEVKSSKNVDAPSLVVFEEYEEHLANSSFESTHESNQDTESIPSCDKQMDQLYENFCLTTGKNIFRPKEDFLNEFMQGKKILAALSHGLQPPEAIFRKEQSPFVPAVYQRLEELNFCRPTSVQAFLWPAVIRGRSAVVIAPPRSGKSLACILPLISSILDRCNYEDLPKGSGPLILMISSSWKGCQSLYHQCLLLTPKHKKFQVSVIYGGDAEKSKQVSLVNGCEILITTPACFLRILAAGYSKYTNL